MSLLIVLFAALMIPLAMARFNITAVPTAIAEIVVGIIIGKTGLSLIGESDSLSMLSGLGVVILIFLSGMEIDFDLFKAKKGDDKSEPSPVKTAVLSFIMILIFSGLIGWGLFITGLFDNIVIATILFSTIALGVVIAALKEKELLSKPYGQTLLLVAVLGEVVPLLALSIYAALTGGDSKQIWLILIIFVVAIILLMRFRGIYHFFERINKTTTQLDIRLAFFIVFTLVTVAETVGAENILGAFLAGIVMKLLSPSEATQEKLTSIGYGFFIPIFFIMTGANLELRSLLQDPQSLILIPLLFVGFIVAKAGLFFVFRKQFQISNALASIFLSATTITLVLPTLEVAVSLDQITHQQAGAFTLAAVLSCIVSPIIFNKLYRPEPEEVHNTSLHIVGLNVLTIPVAQQLSKGWYDIKMVTDDQQNYQTFHNALEDVTLLDDLSEESLAQQGVFDTEVLVLAYRDHEINYQIAKTALAYNVPRIIVRFESHDLENTRYDKLKAQGVELFNTFDVNISLLREMIDSPSTLKMLNDTESGLYEVTVSNRRYTGIALKHMPMIEEITISRIYRYGEFIAPRGDTIIEYGDHLIFTGNKQTVGALRNKLSVRN
ncbi:MULTISPECIES: monovalent cation:proton antiporter family protein [Enterococcus]|uniref:RCK C-terminal domain-containing protein n=1 Tax=Enterococcus sulfureus ATCC 49903 TaxID=1140003 RepID=S0PFS7_9ENTE|nr:cation:proton antiporter [Enterococcus sulfureus]EOT49409.1 hypothetical protein OMY_00337 [Enterococcus sulfureus ATCC 49903]EOT87276.1 hypothetical protein I573_00332 [Enterococcus sulfureus ATCC 49903]